MLSKVISIQNSSSEKSEKNIINFWFIENLSVKIKLRCIEFMLTELIKIGIYLVLNFDFKGGNGIYKF